MKYSIGIDFATLAVEAAIGTWLAPTPGQKITSKWIEIAVGYNTQSSVKATIKLP